MISIDRVLMISAWVDVREGLGTRRDEKFGCEHLQVPLYITSFLLLRIRSIRQCQVIFEYLRSIQRIKARLILSFTFQRYPWVFL